MGIFGENLIGNITGLLSAIGLSLLVGAWYGNGYGPSAWKLASIKAELAKTNKALEVLREEDALTQAMELGRQYERDQEFSKVAPGLKKCVLDKSQVEALNKLSGG